MAEIGRLIGAALAGGGIAMVYMQFNQKSDPSVEAQMPDDVKVSSCSNCAAFSRATTCPRALLAMPEHRPLHPLHAFAPCHVWRTPCELRNTLTPSAVLALVHVCVCVLLAELAAEEDSDQRWSVPHSRLAAQDAAVGQHGGVRVRPAGCGPRQGRRRAAVRQTYVVPPPSSLHPRPEAVSVVKWTCRACTLLS